MLAREYYAWDRGSESWLGDMGLDHELLRDNGIGALDHP